MTISARYDRVCHITPEKEDFGQVEGERFLPLSDLFIPPGPEHLRKRCAPLSSGSHKSAPLGSGEGGVFVCLCRRAAAPPGRFARGRTPSPAAGGRANERAARVKQRSNLANRRKRRDAKPQGLKHDRTFPGREKFEGLHRPGGLRGRPLCQPGR